MKILFLIDSMRSGGKERQLAELLKSLHHRENLSCELVIMSHELHYREILDLGIPIHYFIRKSKKDISIFSQLYSLCSRNRPDIIHVWDSMTAVYAIPTVVLLGIKFVNNMIQNAPDSLKMFGRNNLRSKLTFPFSDVVLANSNAGLRSYRSPLKKSRTIYNGFDFGRIANVIVKQKMTTKLNIDGGHIIGMVASFTETKDYETFISAGIRLLDNRHDITFIAVGDGPTLQRHKSMIPPQHKMRFKFLGKQEDIESIVNIFDIGVLATHTEGISNSIMEYMALGKPVVATGGGGIIEIVVDEVTGFVLPPKSSSAMAEKIEYLLNNPERAKLMGRAGLERIKKDFSIEKMTVEMLSLYNKLCGDQS